MTARRHAARRTRTSRAARSWLVVVVLLSAAGFLVYGVFRAPVPSSVRGTPGPARSAPSEASKPITDDDRRMFTEYETSRRWTRPALLRLVEQELAQRVVRPGATILELGAGDGELFELVNQIAERGRLDLEQVTWIETDKVLEFLHIPRRYVPHAQRVATLPGLTEVDDASVTAVVGLSVLPVIPVADFAASLTSVHRVLRPGGLFVHIDDLGLAYEAEAHHAEREGLIPLPYFARRGREGLHDPMRLAYVDRRRLEQVMASAPDVGLAPGDRTACLQLLRGPVLFVQRQPLGELHPLHATLERLGVLRSDLDVEVRSLIATRLRQAAEQAGLEVLQAHEVVSDVTLDRREVSEVPADVAVVKRRYMVQLHGAATDGPPEVTVSTAAIVVVARRRAP